MNIVVLQGRLPHQSSWRVLPSGEELAELDVSTQTDAGRETVNVVWPAAPATASIEEGAEVVVVGRVRRRFFRTAGGSTQSKTEVVADQVVPTRQAKKVAAAIDGAVAAVEAARSASVG